MRDIGGSGYRGVRVGNREAGGGGLGGDRERERERCLQVSSGIDISTGAVLEGSIGASNARAVIFRIALGKRRAREHARRTCRRLEHRHRVDLLGLIRVGGVRGHFVG